MTITIGNNMATVMILVFIGSSVYPCFNLNMLSLGTASVDVVRFQGDERLPCGGEEMHWFSFSGVQPAVTTVSLAECLQRCVKLILVKVRPVDWCAVILGVSALPEQEIAHPHFSTGADN